MGDLPDTDGVVGVSGEEELAVGGPGEGNAGGGLGVLGNNDVWAELVNNALALEVPDLDAGLGGSAEPVPVGAEDQGVDDITGIEGVEVLPLVKVPEHGDSVLASGGAEGTVGGDGDGVDVSGVSDVVGPQLAVGEVPDLDHPVPSGGDDDGVGGVGGEANAGNPLGVTLLGDGVFALSEGVPELDGLVAGGGDDLPVVSGEGHAEDITGVTNKSAGGDSGVQVPKAEGLVPGGGQTELAVGGDGEVLDEVVVTIGGGEIFWNNEYFMQGDQMSEKKRMRTPGASSWGVRSSQSRG